MKMPKFFIFSCITIISTITLEILHEVVPSNEEKQVPVRVCRFSPDGKMLAKGHDNGSIQVRRIAFVTWCQIVVCIFILLKSNMDFINAQHYSLLSGSCLYLQGETHLHVFYAKHR